jgi:biotin operon repressor
MAGYRTYLPPASELIKEIDRTTLDKIGDQYGVTRQAVHKRLDKWCLQEHGMTLREYRKRLVDREPVPATG